jgi:imidazole glycerol-phosphate synthase subunit HisF
MNKPFFRIIPKLDIKNGHLIKGINLEGLRVLGDPINFANLYYNQGADEICYLDNVATLYGTNNLSKFITRTAKNIFVPLTVGGGIKSISDIENILNAGADKVSINSAAVDDSKLIYKASRLFGSSTISINLEYIEFKGKLFITKSNGRDLVPINPVDWAKKVESLGAGEINITSVNYEGLQNGFDIKNINKISKNINIPVLAHGGCGDPEDVLELAQKTNVSGVVIASFFHYNSISRFQKFRSKLGNTDFLDTLKSDKRKLNLIKKIKYTLKTKGFNVRY